MCRIVSETCRCMGLTFTGTSSLESRVGFSETVFALAGRFVPRLGGRGSGWANPRCRGSFFSGPVGLLAKPSSRGSFDRNELVSGGGIGMGCAGGEDLA